MDADRESLFSSPAEAVAWMRQWASTLTYEGDRLRACSDLLEENASVQWGDISSSMRERKRAERLEERYESLAVTAISYAGLHDNPFLMALVHDQQRTTYGLPECDCEWCVRAGLVTE